MGTQNKDAAPAQARRALLHDQIAFFLVDRVGQRVGAEWRVLRDGCGQIGAVCRHAAGKNELPNCGSGIAVGFGNGFHHTSRAGHVDPPHAVNIQNPCALRIDHKRQVHNRRRLQLAQQQQQLAGGLFSSQVERHKAVDLGMSWGRDINPYDRVIGELLHEPLAKIAGNAGDDDGWFYRIH